VVTEQIVAAAAGIVVDSVAVQDPESAAGSLPRKLVKIVAAQLLRLPGQAAPKMDQCQFLDPTAFWSVSD